LLVATLCRPERVSGWGKPYRDDPAWNGDRREDYNEFKARDRLALVRKTGYPQRMAVLLYFAANFKTLMDRYAVFAQEAGADQTATAEEYPGQSMMKNQHLLAEKHIFGNISQTKAANV
ncbi:hypothetical protein, partial [Arsenicibacter rosenii]|uniref:hypothetical protein n=1 Tax=Arsenicibacter rosenii TaxID=1750698 RepID=UPI0035B68AD3